MKRTHKALLIVVAVAVVAGFVAGCGGFPADSPAKVGDVYIDGADFIAQVEGYAAQYGISEETNPDVYYDLAASILEGLVATELAVQSAPDLGITVTEDEIQDSVDTIVNDYYDGDQAALEADLELDSMSMDDLRKQVKDYMLAGLVRDQIMADIDEPTDEEIAAYYDENMDGFLGDESIIARHILVAVADKTVNTSVGTTESTTTTTEATETSGGSTTESTESTTTTIAELDWAQALAIAAQVRAELLAGGSWTQLAARYSADLGTKDEGGDLGVVATGSLTDILGYEFDNTLMSLDVDQISEPIKTEYGYEIIQITQIVDPQQKTFEEAKDDIKLTLTNMAEDEAWSVFIEAAKNKIGVIYRDEYQPTTTTDMIINIEQVTTTLAP